MKSIHSSEAILIHKLPFQNSSLIVTWLTQKEGRIKTMVKGAHKKTSPFYGCLDLYYECHLQWKQSENSEIDLLQEIQLQETYLHLRRDYSILKAIHYFEQLIEVVTEPRTPIPEFYDLFKKALIYLNQKDASPQLIERYERKLLELSGITVSKQFSIVQSLSHAGFKMPRTPF